MKEIKAGKVEFKVEKAGIVHVPVGKVSFGFDRLLENVKALLEVILRVKPPTSKGVYLRSITLSYNHGTGGEDRSPLCPKRFKVGAFPQRDPYSPGGWKAGMKKDGWR